MTTLLLSLNNYLIKENVVLMQLKTPSSPETDHGALTDFTLFVKEEVSSLEWGIGYPEVLLPSLGLYTFAGVIH
jgi:hypothetical protein